MSRYREESNENVDKDKSLEMVRGERRMLNDSVIG
jgi:hypothetical protein